MFKLYVRAMGGLVVNPPDAAGNANYCFLRAFDTLEECLLFLWTWEALGTD